MLEQSSAEQTGQISEHLIKAAKIITDFFQTPSNFLEFLSKTIWRIDNYRESKEDYSRDVHSYLENMMIDGIVQPWLKNEGDVQLKIADGLKEISDHFGSEYLEMVQLIEKAIDNYTEDFHSEYAYIKNLFLSVSTLYDIEPLLLQAYEESRKEAI